MLEILIIVETYLQFLARTPCRLAGSMRHLDHIKGPANSKQEMGISTVLDAHTNGRILWDLDKDRENCLRVFHHTTAWTGFMNQVMQMESHCWNSPSGQSQRTDQPIRGQGGAQIIAQSMPNGAPSSRTSSKELKCAEYSIKFMMIWMSSLTTICPFLQETKRFAGS